MSGTALFGWQEQPPAPAPEQQEQADRMATPIRTPAPATLEPERKRWYNMPLPLMSASSLPPNPGSEFAMKPGDKVKYAIDHTVGPSALLDRAFLAGLNQLRNKPEEWGQGWDAYGRRYGYRLTRLAVRNSVLLAADVAMGTDPRYDRCDCTGFLARTGHAFKRVVIARKDYGGETINIGRIAGAYIAPAVAYQMYPDSMKGTDRMMNSGTFYLGTRGATNMLREFWPEIHRVIKIGPRPRQ